MKIEITVDELQELASRVEFIGRFQFMTEAEEATAEVLNKIKIKEEEARHASQIRNPV